MTAMWILAQSNNLDRLWDEFSASFRGDRTSLTTFTTRIAVAVLVVLLALALVGLIRAARRHRNPATGPASLLRAALHASGLGWLDRALLLRIARHAAIDHPVAMLLAPQIFRSQCRSWLATVPFSSLRDWARGRVDALDRDLFGPPSASPSS